VSHPYVVSGISRTVGRSHDVHAASMARASPSHYPPLAGKLYCYE
jgi:hypothetical protein